MERFDRQRRIPGWNQQRLQAGCVAVCGRDWLGTFTVWALASMGVGEILWLGEPCQTTTTLAHWFLADPCPFSGCEIFDYPLHIEYGSELDWAIGQHKVDVLVSCTEDPFTVTACSTFAQAHRTTFLAGTTAHGGWYGSGIPPHYARHEQEPVAAMALGALLADAVRETLCPLPGGMLPPDGPLGL